VSDALDKSLSPEAQLSQCPRISRIILVGSVALAVAAPGGAGMSAQSEPGCVDGSQNGASMNAKSTIATPQRPAEVLATAGRALASLSPALQLTLKPTAVNSDSPFLVQVYVKNVCDNAAKGPGELLGVVSFFPAKVNQPEEFVLTPPEKGFPSVAPRNVLVTVQLIPANPSRALVNVTVEVIRARFAE
jgi:hypothetical protein